MTQWKKHKIIFSFFRLGAKIDTEQEEDDGGIYCVIDLLLFELDNVVDDNELKSISDDLVYQCQLALALWSTDGHEDNDHPPSTSEHHANADHLMDKLRQTHLILAVSDLDLKVLYMIYLVLNIKG
jgi:hypothetical protein